MLLCYNYFIHRKFLFLPDMAQYHQWMVTRDCLEKLVVQSPKRSETNKIMQKQGMITLAF